MAKHIDNCQTPEELAETIAYHLKQGGMCRDYYDQKDSKETKYDEFETKRLYGSALNKYNDICKLYPNLPPLQIATSDSLSCLAQIQQLCTSGGNPKQEILVSKILDRAKRLVEIEFVKRRKALPKEVNRVIQGVINIAGSARCSATGERVQETCEREIEIRAKIVLDSFQKAHKAIGLTVTDTLAEDLKKETNNYLEEITKEVTKFLNDRLPETSNANLENTILEVSKKTEVEIGLYVDSLQKQAETGQITYLRSQSIQELIVKDESHTLEFKETFQYNIKTKNIDEYVRHDSLKTIAGFLNSNGGTLLIGISDSGEVKGIAKDKKAMNRANDDKFQLSIRNYIFSQNSKFKPPPIGYMKIEFENIQDLTVCAIDVQPLPKSKISHFEDDVYVRDGNQTLKLIGRDLTDWIKQRD